jgi:hypothetical protein
MSSPLGVVSVLTIDRTPWRNAVQRALGDRWVPVYDGFVTIRSVRPWRAPPT